MCVCDEKNQKKVQSSKAPHFDRRNYSSETFYLEIPWYAFYNISRRAVM